MHRRHRDIALLEQQAPLDLPKYLPYISPISPLYLPCTPPTSPHRAIALLEQQAPLVKVDALGAHLARGRGRGRGTGRGRVRGRGSRRGWRARRSASPYITLYLAISRHISPSRYISLHLRAPRSASLHISLYLALSPRTAERISVTASAKMGCLRSPFSFCPSVCLVRLRRGG